MKKNLLSLQERVAKYPDIHTPEQIESTAHDLENMKFTPTLLLDTPPFLRMNAADLTAELDRLVHLTPEQWSAAGCPEDTQHTDFRDKHIGLLFYHYALLHRLRSNEPEAWDEVNALLEDD